MDIEGAEKDVIIYFILFYSFIKKESIYMILNNS